MSWWRSSWFVLLVVIAYLSLKPANSVNLVEVNDKVGHFLAYFTLFITTYVCFPKWKIRGAALFSLMWSIILELLQNFAPGRTVSIYDVFANAAGVAIGILFYMLFQKWIEIILKKLRILNK